MSNEENERLIQEIVGDVLEASINDQENLDPKMDFDNSAQGQDSSNGFGNNLADYSTAQSDLLSLEDSKDSGDMKFGQDQIVASPRDDMSKEEVGMTNHEENYGGDESVVQDQEAHDGSQNGGTEPKDSEEIAVLQSAVANVHIGAQEPSDEATNVVDNPLDTMSPTSNSTGPETVVSPTNIEPNLEAVDMKGGSEEQEPPKVELILDQTSYEPTTPPAFGMSAQQEEHQIQQHEQQQQQLFNSSLTAHNVPETTRESPGEESDHSHAEHSNKAKNGGEGLSNTAGTHENKPEQKPKTRTCSIL